MIRKRDGKALEDRYAENPNLSEGTKTHLRRVLIKCGDLLGDGDLDPAFEKEVRKEYKHALHNLYPNINKGVRKDKIEQINKAVGTWLEFKGPDFMCGGCGALGQWKQSRKGSYRIICTACNRKYKLG